MWNLERFFIEMLEEVKRQQKEAVLDEEQLRDLIDLTLVLGDEEWFMELTSRLNAITA